MTQERTKNCSQLSYKGLAIKTVSLGITLPSMDLNRKSDTGRVGWVFLLSAYKNNIYSKIRISIRLETLSLDASRNPS